MVKPRAPLRILAFYPLHSSRYGKIVSGVERRFLEISTHLRNGAVEIFTIEYAPSISKSWGYASYHSVELKPQLRHHDFLEALRLIAHGLRVCMKFKCDVIYSPGGFPWGRMTIFLPPFVVSFLCRKPLVVVFHHIHERSRYHNMGIFMRNLIQLTLKHAKLCIMVSKATEEDIKRNYKIGRAIITGNGVNFDTFKEIEKHEKIYDAVYLGRVSKEKGICTLLGAWSKVVRKIPSAKLVLIGGISDYFKDELALTVEKLNLSPNVFFTGFVSDQQVAAILQASKIFVFPSTEEGFGLAILEAMAARLPCILSDLPALRENFENSAIFVKPNKIEGFAQAILDLFFDSEKYFELQREGQRIAQQHSWDMVANKELEALKLSLK